MCPSAGMVTCFVDIKLVETIATLSLSLKMRSSDKWTFYGVFAAPSDALQSHVPRVPVRHHGPG